MTNSRCDLWPQPSLPSKTQIWKLAVHIKWLISYWLPNYISQISLHFDKQQGMCVREIHALQHMQNIDLIV